jgi:hypothetical protein
MQGWETTGEIKKNTQTGFYREKISVFVTVYFEFYKNFTIY